MVETSCKSVFQSQLIVDIGKSALQACSTCSDLRQYRSHITNPRRLTRSKRHFPKNLGTMTKKIMMNNNIKFFKFAVLHKVDIVYLDEDLGRCCVKLQ